MSQRTNIIEVKNLVKRYRKARENAVDGLSFDVAKGEFFALLGPNGAGKTTTISILTTILNKTKGQVTINGFDADEQASDVRRSVGIIFQKPSLDENLTAEENIRLHAMLYGMYPYRPLYNLMPDEYKKKVENLSKLLDIEKEINKPIKTFSGGMKRKIEIVRSLMHSPKVLFLDEPTSGLDPLSRKNLWNYLLEIKKREKITIFLTTHYLEEAEDADRICIIDKGKIVSLGTPNKIKKDLIKKKLIINAMNKKKLTSELHKMKVNFTDNGKIEIVITDGEAQKIISRLKTKLSYLDIHNPTLEEAYLEIVSHNGNGEK